MGISKWKSKINEIRIILYLKLKLKLKLNFFGNFKFISFEKNRKRRVFWVSSLSEFKFSKNVV
jgi:hypothetical protein